MSVPCRDGGGLRRRASFSITPWLNHDASAITASIAEINSASVRFREEMSCTAQSRPELPFTVIGSAETRQSRMSPCWVRKRPLKSADPAVALEFALEARPISFFSPGYGCGVSYVTKGGDVSFVAIGRHLRFRTEKHGRNRAELERFGEPLLAQAQFGLRLPAIL